LQYGHHAPQDHGEVPGQRVREVDRLGGDRGDRDGRELVAGVEQWHRVALLREVVGGSGSRDAQ
jgi:hypothetical protein